MCNTRVPINGVLYADIQIIVYDMNNFFSVLDAQQ